MHRQNILILLLGIFGLCLLSPWHTTCRRSTIVWPGEWTQLRVQVKRFFNPPEQVVFVPQEQVDAIVSATLTALAPTQTPNGLPALTETASPTPAPSPTFAPLPESIALSGIRHEYQQFNNCAPASLSMVLSYWGWPGDQFQTRAYLRPAFEIDDKNVNPLTPSE